MLLFSFFMTRISFSSSIVFNGNNVIAYEIHHLSYKTTTISIYNSLYGIPIPSASELESNSYSISSISIDRILSPWSRLYSKSRSRKRDICPPDLLPQPIRVSDKSQPLSILGRNQSCNLCLFIFHFLQVLALLNNNRIDHLCSQPINWWLVDMMQIHM